MTHIHNYEPIQQTDTATVEICKECKKKLVTKHDKRGRIDNQAYLKEHQRDVCQKTGSTAKLFKRFYGEGGK